MLPSERSSKHGLCSPMVVNISSICSVSAKLPSVPLILKVINDFPSLVFTPLKAKVRHLLH